MMAGVNQKTQIFAYWGPVFLIFLCGSFGVYATLKLIGFRILGA